MSFGKQTAQTAQTISQNAITRFNVLFGKVGEVIERHDAEYVRLEGVIALAKQQQQECLQSTQVEAVKQKDLLARIAALESCDNK